MPAIWIVLAYGAALALAFVLLRYFHGEHCHWYWHASAVVLAFVVGLMPPPPGWSTGPAFDLTVGSLFVFLLLWGVAAPLFRPHHH